MAREAEASKTELPNWSLGTSESIGFAGLLLAARDFQRRHPGALVVSVDHPLARLWLRTGSQVSGERCDLLVLWRDEANGNFLVMAVEVKTSDGDQLNNGPARHADAVIQIEHTFQSRPDKTWLRPYTLHELAGIVWLHGKECLEGSELPQEACYEIAARTRCSPRRGVRDLSEVLRPHFFHQAHFSHGFSQDSIPTLRQVAELMTAANIAAFYEGKRIDYNGLDDVARRYLSYLKQHGAASEATLMQALGLADRRDFTEVTEYLLRLGLIETSSGGRRLTRDGTKYLNTSPPPDLRERISRAM